MSAQQIKASALGPLPYPSPSPLEESSRSSTLSRDTHVPVRLLGSGGGVKNMSTCAEGGVSMHGLPTLSEAAQIPLHCHDSRRNCGLGALASHP